jgi:hypothetical protein
MEIVVPVQPLSQVTTRFEVRDGGDDPLGDVVLLIDAVSFDTGIPEGVQPGHAPLLTGTSPALVPEDLRIEVHLKGRQFPKDAAVRLIDGDGISVQDVPENAVIHRSSERLAFDLEPLGAGSYDVEISWSGGRLTWPGALGVRTPAPSISSVQPANGAPIGGGLIVLEGDGFWEVSELWLGDTRIGALDVRPPFRIEAVVPPGEPGPVDVLLITAQGSALRESGYRYATPEGFDWDPASDAIVPTVVDCSQLPDAGCRPTALALLLLLLALVTGRRQRL